jgi:hypothetical protein
MELDNYTDLSSYGNSPGFRFEFHCSNCTKTWRSPFRPYRKGQVAGFFSTLMNTFHIGARTGVATRLASDAGLAGAKAEALAEARQTAATLYRQCARCGSPTCGDCFSAREGWCRRCLNNSDEPRSAPAATAPAAASAGATTLSCPNCRAPHAGGRFCAECGFDMASTHKSCPECGAMASRQARFCNECGQGF